MLKKLLLTAFLITGFRSLYGQKSVNQPPHLEQSARGLSLIVRGKPFVILGGELHNSSASSITYLRPIWDRLVALHLNTSIAPVSWELIEPREGKFDFSLVDELIYGAGSQSLKTEYSGMSIGGRTGD